MSRITNQIANLNTVDDDDHAADKQDDAESQLFSNTTFFDLDIGRSTDIATTVDESLMQQEKQIQYPMKQQPLEEDSGPVAGPSYSQIGQAFSQQQAQQAQQAHQRAQQQHQAQQYASQQQQQRQQSPFDFSTSQGFSLAGELPPASLSIYDVDPMFHEGPQHSQPPSTQHSSQHTAPPQQQQQPTPQQPAPQQPGLHAQSSHQHHRNSHTSGHSEPSSHRSSLDQHVSLDGHASGMDHRSSSIDLRASLEPSTNDLLQQHHVNRQRPVQRHELADQYAPKIGSNGEAKHESPSQIDDEKRRRNTAASARFRVKKKQREQEMEKNQKLMQRRIAEQEERIKQLEMENTWSKSLVVEKNTARDTTSLGKSRSESLNKQ